MFMPSSVMLIVPFGMPATVELRAVPDVLKPGSDVSESSALRLVSGRLTICAPVRFVAIDGDCVCTTSALSPVTVTFSSSAPTCIVTLTLAGTAAFSWTELRVAVRNPISETVTEYMPPGSEGTVKDPSAPVTASYSSPVPVFLTFTFAPGITPPDESATVPDRDVKKLPCAKALVAQATTSDATTSVHASFTLIRTSKQSNKLSRRH